MQSKAIITLIILITFSQSVIPDTVGFELGKVEGYKLLNSTKRSKLFELNVPQILDARPFKLLEVVGTHYEAGYDYAALLGTF